jgi:hypothetical protein
LKKKILQEWLQGIPRDSIASNNGMAAGTVTGIITQSKADDPDADLLRAVAVIMRKEGVGLGHFASSIRLKRALNKFGLSEGMVEPMLEEIELHCFKNGITAKEFVSEIDKVSRMVESWCFPR